MLSAYFCASRKFEVFQETILDSILSEFWIVAIIMFIHLHNVSIFVHYYADVEY